MRKNQVSINIQRFGNEVPLGYPLKTQVIRVYSDSNNLFAALSKAYAKAINAIEEWERIAARTDISTNAEGKFSGLLLGRKYEENIRLEYPSDSLQMHKELLGYIEKSDLILAVIKSSVNLADARERLERELGYTQQQIQSIFRLRFELFTKEDVQKIKTVIDNLEKIVGGTDK